MLAIIVRYGIVALAAAVAALNGGEASGCTKHRCRHSCRKHHCNRCCPCESAMTGAYAAFGMGCGVPAPAAAFPLLARAVHPPHRPPAIVPPGTLGWTYHRISRLVPEDEHPRTGMIEIWHVPAGMVVAIEGMDGYLGRNGVWYFRTCRPLLPCTPTIHTAYISSPFGVAFRGPNYRAFRLIPGRIVSMRW